jgi:hypothetical protein
MQLRPSAVYTGYWKADLRDGEGDFTAPNNDSYKGGWRDNGMHGYGVHTCAGAGQVRTEDENTLLSSHAHCAYCHTASHRPRVQLFTFV